jgi:tellurite resistance protein TerC
MTLKNTFAATLSGRLAKKAAVAATGLSVLGLGVALIVLPGPGVLVICLGLAILAKQFLWAQKVLETIRKLSAWLKAYTQRNRGVL